MSNAETLQRVSNTLEKVSVRGREDLDRMLGCIQALDRLKNEMVVETKKEDEPHDKSNQTA
jgi:hypothetical protein